MGTAGAPWGHAGPPGDTHSLRAWGSFCICSRMRRMAGSLMICCTSGSAMARRFTSSGVSWRWYCANRQRWYPSAASWGHGDGGGQRGGTGVPSASSSPPPHLTARVQVQSALVHVHGLAVVLHGLQRRRLPRVALDWGRGDTGGRSGTGGTVRGEKDRGGEGRRHGEGGTQGEGEKSRGTHGEKSRVGTHGKGGDNRQTGWGDAGNRQAGRGAGRGVPPNPASPPPRALTEGGLQADALLTVLGEEIGGVSVPKPPQDGPKTPSPAPPIPEPPS